MNSKPFSIRFASEYALFTTPGSQAEPFSSPVPTPSAFVGILCCIYAKPQMTYDIHSIAVEKPVRSTTIRINGMHKAPGTALMTGYQTKGHEVQRTMTVLQDVSYVVTASIRLNHELIDPTRGLNEKSYLAQFMRRAKAKTCFREMHLGVPGTETMTRFELIDETNAVHPVDQSSDFGYMFYGREYTDALPGTNKRTAIKNNLFYQAIMRDGVISVPPRSDPSLIVQSFQAF